MEPLWEQRFESWWRNTPVTNMHLPSRRQMGTVAQVFTSVRDGDKCYAVKTVSSDSKKVMHDNIMLFSEYQIHIMVQELYRKEKTPF